MKRMATIICAAILSASIAITAYAGQWEKDERGWWYNNGNGTWPAASWQWIDGNGDGVAECYYFDQFGYCLMNTDTPDGYHVDGNGAWIVDGIVQTRVIGQPQQNSDNSDNSNKTDKKKVEALMLYEAEPVMKNCVNKETGDPTNKENEIWAKVLEFWADGSSIEFYAGGQYETFKATVAPEKSNSWTKETTWTIQVLGDNDDVLYESDEIDYRTSAFDIEADISGQDTVSIFALRNGGYGGANIIMKQARFE